MGPETIARIESEPTTSAVPPQAIENIQAPAGPIAQRPQPTAVPVLATAPTTRSLDHALPIRAASSQAPSVALSPMLAEPTQAGPAPVQAPVTAVAAVAPPAPTFTATSIPAGIRLSEGLERFVMSRGWQLKWLIEEDYLLDSELPIPGMDIIEAVTWVVQTYQRRGGMQSAVPHFHKGNNVVAIQPMDVRDMQ